MKVTDKMALLLKGVSVDTIKELEAQEQIELELEFDKDEVEQLPAEPDKEKTEALDEKDAELAKLLQENEALKKQIAEINATGKVVRQEPEAEYDAVAVFKELYN